MIIDFIYRLNDLLPELQGEDSKTMREVSEATGTSLPHVLQFLSEGLGKEVDIAGNVSSDEIIQAHASLTQRMRVQIEAREKNLAEQEAKALKAYDRMMHRVRGMQYAKNWHSAFRSLTYFAGQYEEFLPKEMLISLCSEAVHIGIKGKVNLQELGHWLRKGVIIAMHEVSRPGIEEALDLVDTYGEYFIAEEGGKGPLLLGHILAVLEEPAARFELWEQYKQLVDRLYPI